jgi:putative oxidoreductase
MRAPLSSLERHRDLALLVTRVAMGAMFVLAHGLPKLQGGAERWERLGSAVGRLGIDVGHTWFGLAAALAETVGGVLIALGLLTRLACVPMLITMAVAAYSHLDKGQGLPGASHAIETGLFLLLLFFLGPGRHSVDARLG